ncbi:3-phosphoshikimate 1-carboxyvinyltransferase [Aequitasia blattaphilus]|uniref:3-phosphoshikimate 1-carboxyvinyltransferase n=1 Tax=Aequitasia blattaphilus TaxID=2949332 RepID=A0ABT1E6L7_9FIRM|nr:3-phosphoshikimate 1-carboxyvinyltransferase [Aequitasia blattaphilus]MCP1101472.1 3-phosphoshikimate 1-carboxyvinyltransferase [Aequitasia blattaphilus]MCR8614112.1 3-phosphoshikimate 1-carboxyvinyltransferase [Aequitasia blattaphilus]
MNAKTIIPKSNLKGEVTVPGDKSISHRSIMLGSLACGTSEITNFLKGSDCIATMNCFRQMGIEIKESQGHIFVTGKGLRGLKAPASILEVENSGTTTRLLSGILAAQKFPSILSGDSSLNRRPMERIMTPLKEMGGTIYSIKNNGCAPLKIEPGTLHGIDYVSKVASAQVKSALLLAGLYTHEETTVTEPTLSRNHTELMLQGYGHDVQTQKNSDGSYSISLTGAKELQPQKIDIPGDISSAAYLIGAALLTKNSELLIQNVGLNETRSGFIDVIQKMKGNIQVLNESISGGEKRGDILVSSSELEGIEIGGDVIPRLIDEIPMIAVLAATAKGTTVIKDARELKIKETNRIDTVSKNLSKMKGNVIPTEDGMIIEGVEQLEGASINSHFDHRIAMAFAIAGLAARGNTTILDSKCIDVSYPDFWNVI